MGVDFKLILRVSASITDTSNPFGIGLKRNQIRFIDYSPFLACLFFGDIMSGGAFVFRRSRYNPHIFTLRFQILERLTGQPLELSSPITAIELITGEKFSLMPDSIKPWFNCTNGFSNRLTGHLINYPAIHPAQFFTTPEVVGIMTAKNSYISILLACLPDPDNGSFNYWMPPQDVLARASCPTRRALGLPRKPPALNL